MRLFQGTELDRPPRCERCGELESDCGCPPEPEPLIPPEKQTARIAVEKRKKGKVVTVIRGLDLDPAGFKTLLKKLKTRIGSGGTLKGDCIELQGDQVDLALELLTKEGYRPKRAGG